MKHLVCPGMCNMHVLLHECALTSPSPSSLPGPGKKANTIIHLQYLKQWEGGVCRRGEAMYSLVAEKEEMTASGWSRSGEETPAAEMSSILSKELPF